MEMLIVGFIAFVLLTFFFSWFILTYNHFQDYLIKINESEAQIDSILRKRFDLLNKSIGIIKANIDNDMEILEEIVKLRSRKLSNFELDRKLYEGINEFNTLKEKFNNLKSVEGFIKIDVSLANSEIEIIGARKYYNEVISEYNRLVKSFPSSIIAKIYKYSYRNFYDDKDMTDEIKNDFKL